MLIVPILVAAAVLTIAAAVATYDLASASGVAVCARPAVQLSTIHRADDGQRGLVVIRSSAGPTGVDGGLLAILGEARSCAN
jgi:hypothetical protein